MEHWRGERVDDAGDQWIWTCIDDDHDVQTFPERYAEGMQCAEAVSLTPIVS